MKLFGLWGGGAWRWAYAVLFAGLAAVFALTWDGSSRAPASVTALIVAVALLLDHLSRRYDDSWDIRTTVGSVAPIGIAMIVLGPVPAALIGAGSALTDSLLLRARPQHVVGNTFNFALWPFLGGLVAEAFILDLDGVDFVFAVIVLVVLCDWLNTAIVVVHTHLCGDGGIEDLKRFIRAQVPWLIVMAFVVSASAYAYRSSGLEMLVLMTIGLVACEALLLRLDRVEGDLRAERDLHEQYLRMVATAVVSLDPELRLTLINRKAVEMLGLERREDLIGSDWIDLTAVGAFADAERRRYRRLFDEGVESFTFETTVRAARSQTRVVAWHSTLVRDRAGTVTSLLLAGEDVTEQRDAERRMAYLAYNDALTGLPNRIAFDQDLPQVLTEADVCGSAAALLFMDLDGFKRINDRHGHEAGDRLLAEVAARLRAVSGPEDLLARRGGDEFLMLVPDLAVDAYDAVGARRATAEVAERVARAFDAPFPIAGTSVELGISVGSAIYPLDADDPVSLQRAADASMYGLKQRAL